MEEATKCVLAWAVKATMPRYISLKESEIAPKGGTRYLTIR
jgi:hypothetical protein